MNALSLMAFFFLVAFLAFFQGAGTLAVIAGAAFFAAPVLYFARHLLFPSGQVSD